MPDSNRFKKSLDSLDAQINTQDNKNTPNKENNSNSNILSDILDNISTKEPQGKSVALYLSIEIDEIISKTSKQRGISKSKLVDSVLRQVFFKDK
jgi:hypothetical protein